MSGFDINLFIDLNDSLAIHLKCGICTDIFNKPVETQCRHTFCEQCITQWLQTNSSNECPICRQRIDLHFHTNRLINDIINDLKVKCESKDCKAVVPFGSLAKHMIECEFKECAKCGFLMGNKCQHNCLELTKLELAKLQDSYRKLETELMTQKNKWQKDLEQNQLEMANMSVKIHKLEQENGQLKVPLNQMVGKRSFYVSQDVDPKTCKYFEPVELNLFKFIKVDGSFTKIEMNSYSSPVNGSDKSLSYICCLKNNVAFKIVRDQLIKKANLSQRPELKTESGHLIQDTDTPLALNMQKEVKIKIYLRESQHKVGTPLLALRPPYSTVHSPGQLVNYGDLIFKNNVLG